MESTQKKYDWCSKSMHRSNTRQVLDTKENLQERLVLATEKRPKSTQYSHRKTPTRTSAMSTSTETQSRIHAPFMVFPMWSSMPLKEFPKKTAFPKKNSKSLRNTCDTSSTIFSETPPISPLHPPCLQMSRYLSLKAAQAADLNIKHAPRLFWRQKMNRTATSIRFPLQAPPQKRIPFKSPPCSEGELLVQVYNFWGGHVLPKNHQHNLGGPSKVVHHGFLGSQLESLPCLPIV